MDLWNKYWTEVDPTDGTKSPNVAIVGVQKCVDAQDGLQNGFQEVAHTVQNGAEMGQDAAKTRENESKNCGHSRQIRCFCTVGPIQRQRRAIMYLWNKYVCTKSPNVAIVGVQKCAGGQDGSRSWSEVGQELVRSWARYGCQAQKVHRVNALKS